MSHNKVMVSGPTNKVSKYEEPLIAQLSFNLDQSGEYIFTWTLFDESCGSYSSDSINVPILNGFNLQYDTISVNQDKRIPVGLNI